MTVMLTGILAWMALGPVVPGQGRDGGQKGDTGPVGQSDLATEPTQCGCWKRAGHLSWPSPP